MKKKPTPGISVGCGQSGEIFVVFNGPLPPGEVLNGSMTGILDQLFDRLPADRWEPTLKYLTFVLARLFARQLAEHPETAASLKKAQAENKKTDHFAV